MFRLIGSFQHLLKQYGLMKLPVNEKVRDCQVEDQARWAWQAPKFREASRPQGCGPCYSKEMAKVTSKLQVTLPKAIADRYGIRPGDEIDWIAAGESIRVVPARGTAPSRSVDARLKLFDAATERQRMRNPAKRRARVPRERGWTREDLYARGRAR
jgi:AbrB family looped-hinge helix DNA binding protein